jgi:hypothetical protein
MNSISNESMRKLIKVEVQQKAFASFVEQYHSPGPGKELLNHVINIEKCRKTRDPNKMKEEILRLYAHYEKRARAKREVEPHHAAVFIFRSLEPEKPIESLSTEDLKKLIVKSQEDVIGTLVPLFAQFMYSPHYSDLRYSEAVRGEGRGLPSMSAQYSSIHMIDDRAGAKADEDDEKPTS